MATLSVILPNYNHARYLPRRIESILDQTRGDFELLILDDASPDDSREVIARYAGDPRVRLHFNEANSGNTFLQWRKGLEMTSGDYVWIAESDDFAEPTLLERLAAKLDADPRVGLAFCETFVVDADGRPLRSYFDGWRKNGVSDYDLSLFDREWVMDGPEYLRGYMIPHGTIINASGVLFRRAALDAVGGPVTTMKLCGDWLTYCKILARYDVAHVPDHLNHFREHSVNVRSRTRATQLVREVREIAAWIASELGPLPTVTQRKLRTYYVQALLSMERAPPRSKVPFGRIPAALARAGGVAPELLIPTLEVVGRETASEIAYRLGLRQAASIKG